MKQDGLFEIQAIAHTIRTSQAIAHTTRISWKAPPLRVPVRVRACVRACGCVHALVQCACAV